MNKKFLLVMLTSCIIILAIIFGIKVNCFLKSTTNKVSTMMVQEPLSKKIQAYYYKISPHSHVMYGFLRRAYYMFGIPKKGLIHIGARYAEELSYYLDYDINNILWVEADPEAEAKLKQIVQKHSGSKVAMFAATDANGIITFNKTSNDGHSSSILKLKNHLLHYPGIVENKTFQVESRRLDDYLSPKEQQKYNILVLDIQGAELVALKGATNMLDSIDAIITETNYDELYEGAVLIKDLDAFLATYQFTRVESASAAFYTGDALYIKDNFSNRCQINSNYFNNIHLFLRVTLCCIGLICLSVAYINTSSHFKVNLYRFYYAKQDSLNRKINNKFYSLLVPVNYINPKTLNYKIHNPAAWVINQITKDFTNFSDVSRDNVLRTFNLLAETKSLVLFTIDNGVLSVNKKNNLNEACENAVILYSRIFEYLAQNGYINNVSFLIRFSDFFDDDTSYNSTSLAPILTTSTDEHLQRILNKHVILIPDFMSLEDIPKLIPKIKKASQIYRWDKKQNKVYWRGGYADVSGLRKSIVEYSTKHPDSIIDAKFVETKKDFIAPEFQLQSKFLLNIDGYGPSWTRPIWQLYSNSVMLKQNSELIQWYYAALVPDVHFIVVDNDPVEIIKKINSYPDEVLYKIALAGSDFAANNLTINDMVAYIALVVQKYENLQNNLIQF